MRPLTRFQVKSEEPSEATEPGNREQIKDAEEVSVRVSISVIELFCMFRTVPNEWCCDWA